ncbi:vitamin D 25-hydroxylase-like [Babylonia areolata]|uniref:vitamin D 25-hydroxylase-like n=1 Tax=Babylonia areolata TaxID=304850 RepID=UPI003FD49AE1
MSSNVSQATNDAATPFITDIHAGPILVGVVVFLGTLYLLKLFRAERRYPPGPRGWPLLGYLPILRSSDKRRLFAELRAEYGDVFSFKLGCRLVVVVNGFDSVKQLFLQQGGSFVDRPQVFTFTHLGQGKGVVNSSGAVWKEHRKFTLNALRNLGIGKASFEDKVQEELRAFCQVLDDTNGADFDPGHALQTAIANIICSIAFGKRFQYDDPIFVRFLEIFEENMGLAGGTALLNFFPFLHSLPGDLFKSRKMLRNVDFVQGYLRQWLDNHQKRFSRDNVSDFIDAYLDEIVKRQEKKKPRTTFCYDQLLKTVGDLLVGGTETTGTTLRWFLIFLVHWPHVQRRMRQEIDSVYPGGAKPSVQDRRRLPYVEAAILECQRFADIAPFSVTHAASEEVEVEGGLLIPKGTIVIPNVHSVHYDPGLWRDPEHFRPERFLDDKGEVVRPEFLIPFFLGKRSCPGEGLARMELFQFLTTLLQRYEILPSVQGTLPSLQGHIGITYTPSPYTVRFVKRQADDTSTTRADNAC